jgi:hypothetical protein
MASDGFGGSASSVEVLALQARESAYEALPDTWEDTYACTDKWTADASDDNDTDAAWPPDMNRDTEVNVLDVLLYKPKLTGVYDLTAEGSVDILDLLLYKPFVNTSCTNP